MVRPWYDGDTTRSISSGYASLCHCTWCPASRINCNSHFERGGSLLTPPLLLNYTQFTLLSICPCWVLFHLDINICIYNLLRYRPKIIIKRQRCFGFGPESILPYTINCNFPTHAKQGVPPAFFVDVFQLTLINDYVKFIIHVSSFNLIRTSGTGS